MPAYRNFRAETRHSCQSPGEDAMNLDSRSNAFSLHALALAAGLAFSWGAAAQAMSKDQYEAGKKSIAADYKAANEACASRSGNARDICKAEASGREKVAKAQLEAQYKPSDQATYEVRAA